jgi:assimilatory nitrate reductase catalytic subunit
VANSSVQAIPNLILTTAKQGVKTTCPYCGVGCGVQVRNENEKMSLVGDAKHPANFGKLCIKGKNLLDTIDNSNRMPMPIVNNEEATWDNALDYVADGFKQCIEKYGPDSVAFYVSGQLLTEDYYVANKLMKGFIGSANIDTNSRLCMSSAVAAHKRAFGEDVVPMSYSDITKSDLIVICGSNLAWCHPIIYKRIREEKAKRANLKVVVIDPRYTASCEIADLHLAIAAGGDLVLFNGLLNYLANQGLIEAELLNSNDQGLTRALELAAIDSEKLSAIGLSQHSILKFFELFAESEKVVTLFSQGINQAEQGVDQGNAIINCHIASAKIGKQGSGPFSITGQPNAMGGREVGALCNTLAGHIEFNDRHLYPALEGFWHTKNIARKPGLKAVELFDAMDNGTIKAIWIMATNPALSMPDINKVTSALAKCPLVVVSDCVANNDTLAFANVKLPAHSWGEKSGTVTNSERRISRQRGFLTPFGHAKADWWIISQVAMRMGFKDAFNYQHESEIFAEHSALSGLANNGSRAFDISAFKKITQQQYSDFTPIQWPQCDSHSKVINDQLLFADKQFYTPSKKAQLIAVQSNKFNSNTSDIDRAVFTLNTGRLRDHWHTQTRTAKSALLSNHYPEPLVEINPQDAQALAITDQSLVSLKSRLGEVVVRASISSLQKMGNVFMPIHWTSLQSAQGGVCQIIEPIVDPISGQPAFKHSQVSMSAFASGSEALLLVRERLTQQFGFYQVEQKVEQGYCYHIASNKSPRMLLEHLQIFIKTLLDNTEPSVWAEDDKGCYYRYCYYQNGGVEAGIFVGEKKVELPQGWISHFFQQDNNNLAKRQVLTANVEAMSQQKIFCQCLKISYDQVTQALKTTANIDKIRELTGAGNGCGSCIGDISLLLAVNNHASNLYYDAAISRVELKAAALAG